MNSRRDYLKYLLFIKLSSLGGCIERLMYNFKKYDDSPANPDINQTTMGLLSYLQSLPGKGWLSGQRRSYKKRQSEQEYIKDVAGFKPAIRGFGVSNYFENNIDEVIQSWMEEGQLITFDYHMGAPPLDDGVFENTFRESDIDACLSSGTEENNVFMEKLDRVSDVLKTLREYDVPILWRPYHEADGEWFWWGKEGSTAFKKLWRHQFNYFVEDLDLDNLIWVYSASHDGPKSSWYPGDEYVDIIGIDTYLDKKPNIDWSDKHNRLKELSPNKPIALTETDAIPDPDHLQDSFSGFIWFLCWYGEHLRYNKKPHIKYVYNHNYTINAEEIDFDKG